MVDWSLVVAHGGGHGAPPSSWALSVLAVVLIGAATLGGGLLAARGGGWQAVIFPIAAGFLLATGVTHLIAEAGATALTESVVGLVGVALGVYALLAWAHHLAHRTPIASAARWVTGFGGIAGFVLHRYLEGLALGVGLLLDGRLAALVSVAIVAHAAAEGAALVVYLHALRATPKAAVAWLALTAATPAFGAATAVWLPLSPAAHPLALAALAGLFAFAAHVVTAAALTYTTRTRAIAWGALGVTVVAASTQLVQ